MCSCVCVTPSGSSLGNRNSLILESAAQESCLRCSIANKTFFLHLRATPTHPCLLCLTRCANCCSSRMPTAFMFSSFSVSLLSLIRQVPVHGRLPKASGPALLTLWQLSDLVSTGEECLKPRMKIEDWGVSRLFLGETNPHRAAM